MTSLRMKIGHANRRFEERWLAPGKYLLGREHCDIELADENVSARHAGLTSSRLSHGGAPDARSRRAARRRRTSIAR